MAHPQQRILDLLSEVLAIARAMAPAVPRAHGPKAKKSPGKGIYPHTSKYNPWRAYVWDPALKRTAYLGAFPTVAQARAAQQDHRNGQRPSSGTKTHLRAVA